MTTYITGTLQESKSFYRTEDAAASKTWIKDDKCDSSIGNTWLGFSRIPSANMLMKRGALEKCPHDYMLKTSPSTLEIFLVAPASKMKWTLKFNNASEQLKWLTAHIRKIVSKNCLPEVKRRYVMKHKQTRAKIEISDTLTLRSL